MHIPCIGLECLAYLCGFNANRPPMIGTAVAGNFSKADGILPVELSAAPRIQPKHGFMSFHECSMTWQCFVQAAQLIGFSRQV